MKESMTHTQEKKADNRSYLWLGLVIGFNKDSTAAIINVFKKIKKIMFKEKKVWWLCLIVNINKSI